MIEAEQLCKQFGAFQAVRGISLTIQPGEVLALLGPNGAGKTTTVRMFAAILKPTSGWARIDGLDVVRDAQQVRSRVGLLTEYPGLYGRMRAMEYLDFFGTLLGLDANLRQQRAERLLHRFGLWEARDKRLDSYSKGMRQKIALVRALIHDPPVLFLDEPTTAMDPQSARTVRDAIGDLRSANRTILLTTHNLTEAEELADRIAIIGSGQVIAEGTMTSLMQQLMGDPVWRMELATHAADDQLRSLLADLVTLENVQEGVARYRCSDPRHINPQIMQRLMQAGLPLVSLAEVTRSLEDVYLGIVDQHTPVEQQQASTSLSPRVSSVPQVNEQQESIS
jgi:ABC-2 type transport system ATP-binding protein